MATIKRSLVSTFPGLAQFARSVRGQVRGGYFATFGVEGERYQCPICGYKGPFLDHSHTEGRYAIKFTECPRCELFERHRLQFLVLNELFKQTDFAQKSILHFAPEPRFEKLFQSCFRIHHTADIVQPGVDYLVDICELPFDDGTYDFVFASHVLEHVAADSVALAEVRRILRPGGIAVLPVPVVSPRTIEYSQPNDHEFGHVRAVGLDYFDRYKQFFSRVEVSDSTQFSDVYQLYTYEDRTMYPTDQSPRREPMQGEKHADYVPVCFV